MCMKWHFEEVGRGGGKQALLCAKELPVTLLRQREDWFPWEQTSPFGKGQDRRAISYMVQQEKQLKLITEEVEEQGCSEENELASNQTPTSFQNHKAHQIMKTHYLFLQTPIILTHTWGPTTLSQEARVQDSQVSWAATCGKGIRCAAQGQAGDTMWGCCLLPGGKNSFPDPKKQHGPGPLQAGKYLQKDTLVGN